MCPNSKLQYRQINAKFIGDNATNRMKDGVYEIISGSISGSVGIIFECTFDTTNFRLKSHFLS